MTFANPLALLWGLLAVPIGMLYLRRVRLRREPVATNMIWQRVFAAEQARSAWQRWRHPVSLAVQLAVLLLLVLALADPQIPGPRRLVLIVDNSGSMNAADVKPTRLAKAKQAARGLIAGLRPGDRAAVLSAADAPGVRCTLTNDRTALLQAIESIPAARGTAHVTVAAALARRMLGDLRRGEITVLSDGRFPGAEQLAQADDVKLIRFGKQTNNVAISRFRARRSIADPLECQVLVEVSNFSDETAECRVTVELDGKQADADAQPAASKSVKLTAGERRQLIFAITASGPGRLTARLEPADALANDNEASVRVPPAGDAQPGAMPDAGLLVAENQRGGEGDLRAAKSIGLEAAAVSADSPGSPAWLYLVAAGVLLLALEWCLYQRRWIC